jgi:hypothetical protein
MSATGYQARYAFAVEDYQPMRMRPGSQRT